MDFQTFTGDTIDQAITKATVTLGVTSDKIEYKVVEKGSSGFLGLGSKDAVISARIKDDEAEEKADFSDSSNVSLEDSDSEKDYSDDVIKKAKDIADKFLLDVTREMGLDVTLKSDYDAESHSLMYDLSGPEMGIIIGKRGSTLDSLQYLCNLSVSRKTHTGIRIKLDTENYRERRKETLENLAHNVASKVRRTRKSVTLERMNPYERRIIHSALSDNPYVTTHSEGEEPYRHIVVTLK
jgi:spoIIIJ-associated protein